jgi:sulfur-oxidizing protein SoxY
LIEDIEYSFNLWPVMPSIELASITLSRRSLLRLIFGSVAFYLPPGWGATRPNPRADSPLVSGPGFTAILDGLMGKSPAIDDHGLSLEIPEVAENGALVPIVLNTSATVQDLYLLAEGNPGPLLASFHFQGSALPKVSLRVKLNQSGPVTALSKGKNGWMRLDRQVKVAVGGCG